MIWNNFTYIVPENTSKLSKIVNVNAFKDKKVYLKPKTFVSEAKKYGKHKIKRHLYHITTEENFKKILDVGYIKPSCDGMYFSLNGVFMVELQNLLKKWKSHSDFDDRHLGFELIKQIGNQSRKLVLLRIFTQNLKHYLLCIRSQNRLFGQMKNKSSLVMNHAVNGAPAKDIRLYNSEAIEYIYQTDIPLKEIELVGKADLNPISKELPRDEQNQFALNVFRKLFNGQPEMHAIEQFEI